MKRIVTIIVGLCVIFFSFSAARAANVENLKKQIEERESQIKKLEAEIVAYQKSLETQSGVSSTLKGEIARVESEIKKLASEVRLTETKIQKTEFTIQSLSGSIEESQQTIRENQKSLAELVRKIRDTDGESLMEILLLERSISDFFDNVESLGTVNEGLQGTIDAIRIHKKSLEDERLKKSAEERNLELLRDDLVGRKSATQSVNSTKKQLLQASKNQESRYQKMLKEREQQRALIQKEMETIENDLKALIDQSSIPKKGSGVLGWPVPEPLVTQQFGFTEFATTYGSDVYRGNGHNGIDLRAPIGTRILSAADGIIKDLGNADTLCPGGSYGKWILIEHPNGLSTLYAHLSSIDVTRGQTVSRGQRVGFSGNTGYVTGPHLHFTVYASNTYQLRKTRNCGYLPVGGYLNPIDYL